MLYERKNWCVRETEITIFRSTVSPPYMVLCYTVNSQLQCLVIITLDSIYCKKNSKIRYPLVFCLHCNDCMHIWFSVNLYLASFVISLSVFSTLGVKYQC